DDKDPLEVIGESDILERSGKSRLYGDRNLRAYPARIRVSLRLQQKTAFGADCFPQRRSVPRACFPHAPFDIGRNAQDQIGQPDWHSSTILMDRSSAQMVNRADPDVRL